MVEISPFELINPLELDLADNQEALKSYQERLKVAMYLDEGDSLLKTSKQYRGSGDLLRLIKDQAIGAGVIIRIWQTDLPEFHLLTRYGLVPREFRGDKSTIITQPFDRLNHGFMGRPYAWYIEGFEFYTNADIENWVNST